MFIVRRTSTSFIVRRFQKVTKVSLVKVSFSTFYMVIICCMFALWLVCWTFYQFHCPTIYQFMLQHFICSWLNVHKFIVQSMYIKCWTMFHNIMAAATATLKVSWTQHIWLNPPRFLTLYMTPTPFSFNFNRIFPNNDFYDFFILEF